MISNTMSIGGFICINNILLQAFGPNAAVLVGKIYSLYEYYKENKLLDKENMFYFTKDMCYSQTKISPYEQIKALKELEAAGIVKSVNKGIPRRRFITFDESKLLEFISNYNKDNCNDSCEIGITFCEIEENNSNNIDSQITNNNQNYESNIDKIFTNGNENFQSNNNIINNNIENNKNIVNDKSFTTNSQQNEFENFINNYKQSYSAYKLNDLDNKQKKEINPNTTKKREYLVEYIKSLDYNDTIKDVLFKWYFSVAVGKVSVNMLKDKLNRLKESTNKDDDIYESINNAYINSWLAFYPPKKNNYNKKVVLNSQGIERVKDEDRYRNPDGTYMVY